MTITINKTEESDRLTLSLDGRLNTTTAPLFQQALVQALEDSKEILLDFARLAYIASAGLRVLLLGEKTAKANSASMRLCNVSEEIMEVFDMTGFSEMLTIVT